METKDELFVRTGLVRAVHVQCDEMTFGTPMQCDCFTAGEDHNFAIMVYMVNKILDGKDDGLGVNFEPWGTLRQRLLTLVHGMNRSDV